jgi:uncharacterized damage-inducible protein DinB
MTVCGAGYKEIGMPLVSLIEQFAAGPARLAAAVRGLSPEQVRARPIPGKWSTLEVVCHLADFEIVFADRLKSVIAEENPVLPGRDEGAFAARLAYDQRELVEELKVVELCRGQLVRILRTLSEADLARQGTHNQAGPLLLGQLLERSIQHVVHHVQFIDQKREALGLASSAGTAR